MRVPGKAPVSVVGSSKGLSTRQAQKEPDPIHRVQKGGSEAGGTGPSIHPAPRPIDRWLLRRRPSKRGCSDRPDQSQARLRRGSRAGALARYREPPGCCETAPLSRSSHARKESTEFLGCLLVRALRGCRSCDDHKVGSTRGRAGQTPVAFPQPALDPVANHGIADLLAHSDANSRSLVSFWLGSGHGVDDQITSDNPTPATLRRQKTRSRSQAIPAAEAFVAALVGHGAYFLGTVTVSFLRPLRRRRRSTSRPSGELMRLRKPWVRLRLFRCGWKVLFDT